MRPTTSSASGSASVSSNGRGEDNAHPFYRLGDVDLRSQDGTILRVDARWIDASSAISDTANKKRKRESILHTAVRARPTEVIEAYIKLITTMHPTFDGTSFETVFGLWNLCVVLEVKPELMDILKHSLLLQCRMDPTVRWSVFVWAGWKGDVAIARAVLRTFTPQQYLKDIRLFDWATEGWKDVTYWDTIDGELPRAWRHELVRLTLAPTPDPDHTLGLTESFGAVADKFDP